MFSQQQGIFHSHALAGHNILLTGQAGSGKGFAISNLQR